MNRCPHAAFSSPGPVDAMGSLVAVRFDLLTPGIEVGLVTTNLDAMVAFYEGFLELEFQGEVEFPGGSQRRYSLGSGVVKLVTYDPPPPAPAAAAPKQASGTSRSGRRTCGQWPRRSAIPGTRWSNR
jgi:hypothetical protein